MFSQRHGRGGVILLVLITVWFAITVQSCLAVASAGVVHGPKQDMLAEWQQDIDADQTVTGNSEYCPAVVCDVLEISQDQLAKQSGLFDILKPLFLAVVLWILPAMLLLASPRPLFLRSPPSPKPPPPLRFRVLLI